MATRAVKLLTGFFIAAVLLVVAALVFTLAQPAPAPPPLPKPNGYDDLVRAGGMVADKTSDFETMSEECSALPREQQRRRAETGEDRTEPSLPGAAGIL